MLILARELDLHNKFADISIQNLIPKDCVFRYVADLHGDLSQETGALLDVNLVSVPKNSMLGVLKGSDLIFEIYTESYGYNPFVIQGAGDGAAVTARGVFGDILRISD